MASSDDPVDEPVIRFEGAIYATVSSFTMSPDQKILSGIFDDFAIAWPEQGRVKRVQERGIAIAVSPDARGTSVSIALRGYWQTDGSPVEPRLTLRAGATTLAVPLADSSIDFFTEVALPGDDTPFAISIEAEIPAPGSDPYEATLTVTTFDIALLA